MNERTTEVSDLPAHIVADAQRTLIKHPTLGRWAMFLAGVGALTLAVPTVHGLIDLAAQLGQDTNQSTYQELLNELKTEGPVQFKVAHPDLKLLTDALVTAPAGTSGIYVRRDPNTGDIPLGNLANHYRIPYVIEVRNGYDHDNKTEWGAITYQNMGITEVGFIAEEYLAQ